MAVTLASNPVHGAIARAHNPVTMSCASKEPAVIKLLAVIAYVAGATLVAGDGASACGNGAKEALVSP